MDKIDLVTLAIISVGLLGVTLNSYWVVKHSAIWSRPWSLVSTGLCCGLIIFMQSVMTIWIGNVMKMSAGEQIGVIVACAVPTCIVLFAASSLWFWGIRSGLANYTLFRILAARFRKDA